MHGHTHTKAAIDRMARAIGQRGAGKRMLEEGRDCSDVLVQLAAVRAEITNVSKLILKDHLDHCIVDAVREQDEETIARLKGAIDRLL